MNEHKAQKFFVKDGDDEYVPRRPVRRYPATTTSVQRVAYKKCECGGKLKPRGSIGCDGRSSAKCNKCGVRTYTKHYKGIAGLVHCY
jgi:hypothetical protein